MTKKPDYSKIKLQKGRISVPHEPILVSGILDKVAKKLKLNDHSEDYSIILFWEEFLNSQNAESLLKYSFAHRITKDRKLVIGIRSTVIANELQFIKHDLEKSFLDAIKDRFKTQIKSLLFELRDK